MTEWWSYRPSDFLMYSPRVYFRQIETYNNALWPLQLMMLLVGIGLVWLLLRPRQNDRRIVAIVLAALWLFVGWAYLWSRLSSINWAATYAACGFAVQAILMIVIYVMPSKNRAPLLNGVSGPVVAAVAVLLYPGLSLIAGRGLGTSEVFGIMPDPTAIATIGFLASARQRYDFVLFVIPTLWCIISSVTLYAMVDTTWWIPLAICVLGIAATFARHNRA
jgi:hypothetical protein